MVILFLIFFILFCTSQSLHLSLNSSILLPLSALNPPSSKSFIKEVIDAVSAKKKWDPEGNPRISAVEADSVRVCAIQSFEFHVRFGGATMILKFSEEFEAWRKAEMGEVEFGPDLVNFDLGFREEIKKLSLEGPIEVISSGGAAEISVHLPFLNITHQGLKRVLVGKGITIELYSSNEVSLFYPYDISFFLNNSSSRQKQFRSHFYPLGPSSCSPLVSVRVTGPSSLVAFRIPDKKSYIKTLFLSHNTIELLPNKCFTNNPHEQIHSSASPTLTAKFSAMERLLNSILHTSISHDRSSRLLKTKITSSKLVKFRVEVERNITENDRSWNEVAQWRTRPTVERTWVEIVGRFEGGGGGMKPVFAKLLSRPLMVVESSAWSHLMSNVSFMEFQSVVVPPEALTLDIK